MDTTGCYNFSEAIIIILLDCDIVLVTSVVVVWIILTFLIFLSVCPTKGGNNFIDLIVIFKGQKKITKHTL